MNRSIVIFVFACIALLISLSALGVAIAGDPTLQVDRAGQAIQGALTPTVAQKIVFDGAVSNGTAFTTKIVRVTATTACFLRFGSAATGFDATSSYHYMGAGTTEYFRTRGFTYISAIKATSAGVLYISEME
jgi:hypothetical protein